MADDSTGETIAITTGVVGALRAAGMLRTEEAASRGGAAPPPPAQPPPPPMAAVGDIVTTRGEIVGVTKILQTEPSDETRFVVQSEDGVNYEFAFPPNDERYISELTQLHMSTRYLTVYATVEITQVVHSQHVHGKLRRLQVHGSPVGHLTVVVLA